MTFLDTNILVYAALDQDPVKKRISAMLVAEAFSKCETCTSAQVLKEFANAMFRKSDKEPEDIRALVDVFARLPLVPDTADLIRAAIDLKIRLGLQYYDALIVAAARQAGCDVLYTEDMAEGCIYDGVRIVNPFRR